VGELGGHRERHRAAHLAAAGPAGEERHHRPDPLAARRDEVARRASELLLGVVGRPAELLLEGEEVLRQRRDVGEGGLGALRPEPALRGVVELREDGPILRHAPIQAEGAFNEIHARGEAAVLAGAPWGAIR
jgi:hypothetical protein